MTARVTLHRADMRAQFWLTLATILLRNPAAVNAAMRLAAFYVHLGPFSKFVIGRIDDQIAAIDADRWIQPPLVSLPVPAQAVAELTA